mmetsp:Transcript_40098/g.126058  ORF Transcript_40098/g.126058 Transcript_40098/m.126058 type:complete len:270 (-) Transcript_40098:322-1131(-)
MREREGVLRREEDAVEQRKQPPELLGGGKEGVDKLIALADDRVEDKRRSCLHVRVLGGQEHVEKDDDSVLGALGTLHAPLPHTLLHDLVELLGDRLDRERLRLCLLRHLRVPYARLVHRPVDVSARPQLGHVPVDGSDLHLLELDLPLRHLRRHRARGNALTLLRGGCRESPRLEDALVSQSLVVVVEQLSCSVLARVLVLQRSHQLCVLNALLDRRARSRASKRRDQLVLVLRFHVLHFLACQAGVDRLEEGNGCVVFAVYHLIDHFS